MGRTDGQDADLLELGGFDDDRQHACLQVRAVRFHQRHLVAHCAALLDLLLALPGDVVAGGGRHERQCALPDQILLAVTEQAGEMGFGEHDASLRIDDRDGFVDADEDLGEKALQRGLSSAFTWVMSGPRMAEQARPVSAVGAGIRCMPTVKLSPLARAQVNSPRNTPRVRIAAAILSASAASGNGARTRRLINGYSVRPVALRQAPLAPMMAGSADWRSSISRMMSSDLSSACQASSACVWIG